MKKTFIIFLLLTLSLLWSCNNNDKENEPNADFYMKATVGTEAKTWESDNNGGTRITISAQINISDNTTQTSISANNIETLETLQILISADAQEGQTYNATSSVLGGNPSVVLCNYTIGQLAYTTASIITNNTENVGSVTITERTEDYITGTFSFRVLAGTGDELAITNGEFKAQL